MGMTDLQFKSYLKQLIHRLETASGKETKEAILEEIAALMRDLREDLQG